MLQYNNKKIFTLSIKEIWTSTSIAALLLGGVASPIAYADSQNESSPSTVQESTTNSEQQTTTASSSTIESSLPSNQEETKSDEKGANSEESTTTSQVEGIAPVEEAIEESATTQGTWGTASYEFNASTGTLTVNSGTISSSITGIVKTAVKNIIFEDGVVAPAALGGVFTQFSNLTSITGYLNTKGTTSMARDFKELRNLTSIDVSSWDTSSVTSMSGMFSLATHLSTIKLGDKSTFSIGDTGLPKIETSPLGYSGKWVKSDGSNSYDSSANFMEQYDESTPGTYVWQGTAYSLDVKNIEIYEGGSWKASDGFISGSCYLDPASEKVETKVDFADSLISVVENEKVDTNTPGVYHVTYKLGNVEKQATVTVLENKQSLNGSDFTMTVGDSAPTVSDFQATATDKDGKELDVTVDLSKADLTKAGTYDVVLSTSDGQSKTVKLTVKDKVTADKEETTPSTGDKGSTSGTSTSVVNSSNNTIKTPSGGSYSSTSLPKTGDESSAASIVVGLGLALISFITLGFVRKRNK